MQSEPKSRPETQSVKKQKYTKWTYGKPNEKLSSKMSKPE